MAERGVTAVEVALAMAVVAVLTGMMLPAYNLASRAAARSAAYELAAELRLLRQWAVAYRQPCTLEFTGPRSYRLTCPGGRARRAEAPPAVRFAPAIAGGGVTYGPDGLLGAGAGEVAVAAAGDGRRWKVRIARATGAVSVEASG